MPAKPLTAEQLEDASRLLDAWATFKRHNAHATQEWLAHQCGWRTQGAVSQYLLGRIPLNLPALLKFAEAFDVAPSEISPTIASQLPGGGMAAPAQPPTSITDPSAGTGRSLTQAIEAISQATSLRDMQIAEAVAILQRLPDGALSKGLGYLQDLLEKAAAPAAHDPEDIPIPSRKKKVLEFTGLHPEPAKDKRKTR